LNKFTEKAALTDSETLEEVLKCLTEHISIDTQGAFDQKDLFQILVRAASNKDSIENTAKILPGVPCNNDIRYHLEKINDFEEVEKQFNLALKTQLPAGLKKKKQTTGKSRWSQHSWPIAVFKQVITRLLVITAKKAGGYQSCC
jgi:hypothetical protein